MPSREGPSLVTLCPDPSSHPVLLTSPWSWSWPAAYTLCEPPPNPSAPRAALCQSRPAVRLALGSAMGGAEGFTPGTREFGLEGGLCLVPWRHLNGRVREGWKGRENE